MERDAIDKLEPHRCGLDEALRIADVLQTSYNSVTNARGGLN